MARVHIVEIGSVLVATLDDDLDDAAALALQDDVAARVVARRATGVLLDLSALDFVDSFICKALGDTAKIVQVLGAQVAIVGMRPAVAITIVELGLPLDGIVKALNLDAGMRALAAAGTAPGGRNGDRGP